jgi:DNA polymerase III alpha subunit (gram-positive type)
MARYICFDTETTGLQSSCNLLTAHFIVLNKNLERIDALDLKMKYPVYTVYTKALEVNKINLVDHDKDPNSLFITDANNKLVSFLQKNKGPFRYIPIGHNINFDVQFVKSSKLLLEEEYSKYISSSALDTLTIANFLKVTGVIPSTQPLNLVSLCKFFNISKDDTNAHTAEYDTKMTIELLKNFKEKIEHSKEEYDDYKSSSKKRKM